MKNANAACNDYIQQLSNGDIKFSVTYPVAQAYVEVFATKNGLQHLATNIVGSEVQTTTGYAYSYVMPASFYATGDNIQTRFYSYVSNGPGVFVPGPSEGVWSDPFFYNQTQCTTNTTGCDYPDAGNMKLTIQPDGSVTYSITFDHLQAYVELFAKKDGLQNIALNIVGSQINNPDGTYTYTYTTAPNMYEQGSQIQYRFYSYEPSSPGVFTPGPTENVWSQTVTYVPCGITAVYVSLDGNDNNPGTKTAPVKSILKGLALAAKYNAKDVYVAEGTYTSSYYDQGPVTSVVLSNGINLLGGYSLDFNERDLTFTNHVTTLTETIDWDTHPRYFTPAVVYARKITLPTIFEGFVITGGMATEMASGLVIDSCTSNFIVRYNKITNNSYNFRCPWPSGGNLYESASSAQIYNNIITNGSRPDGQGQDFRANGSYSGVPLSDVHDNTFTCSSSQYIYSTPTNFHDNTYVCSTSNARLDETEPVISSQMNTSVQLSNLTADDYTVEVYGLLGQRFIQVKNQSNISLSALQNGTYVIVLSQGEHKTSKLILVQR